jgi:hypothetical protein
MWVISYAPPVDMKQKFVELEQFLSSVVSQYPPLPRATDVEDQIDNIVAYKAMVTDYNRKAKYKIQELFAGHKIEPHKKHIHKIALRCLHSYNR